MATPGTVLLQKHHGRIPIVCRPHDGIAMKRTKFLVDGNSHVSEFMGVIRNNVELKRHEAIFLFVNNTLVPNSHTFFKVYEEHETAMTAFCTSTSGRRQHLGSLSKDIRPSRLCKVSVDNKIAAITRLSDETKRRRHAKLMRTRAGLFMQDPASRPSKPMISILKSKRQIKR